MRKVLIGAILIFIAAAGASGALNEGDREISIFGNYFHHNFKPGGGSGDAFGGGVRFGHFMTDQLEMGFSLVGSWDNDVDLYYGGLDMKHYLCPMDPWSMYWGGQVSYGYAENGQYEDGIHYGPLAGFRFMSDTGPDMYIEYQYLFFDGGTLDNAFDESQAVFLGWTWKY